MMLVFVYGPPAAGKFTVSRKLAEMLHLPLFHNHLVVDAVGAVFPFGSDAFVRLREHFWMEVFRSACAEGRSLIFTFQPEASVAPNFAATVAQLVRDSGGEMAFVYLTLSVAAQEARVENKDRSRFGKLRSRELLRSLHTEFVACERAMPAPDLVIDTEAMLPDEAAQRICDMVTGRLARRDVRAAPPGDA